MLQIHGKMLKFARHHKMKNKETCIQPTCDIALVVLSKEKSFSISLTRDESSLWILMSDALPENEQSFSVKTTLPTLFI